VAHVGRGREEGTAGHGSGRGAAAWRGCCRQTGDALERRSCTGSRAPPATEMVERLSHARAGSRGLPVARLRLLPVGFLAR
jgi:hypothetical protein